MSEQDERATKNLWRISGMGMELALAIAVMGGLGWLLDRWLGTAPGFLLGGLIVGALGGGYNFVRTALQLNRAAQASYRAHRREEGVGGVGSGGRGGRGSRGLAADVTPEGSESEDELGEPDDFDRF